MNFLSLTFCASGTAAAANFFFRKGSISPSVDNRIEKASEASGYLLLYYLLSLVFSFLINTNIWNTPFNGVMFIAGGMVGLLNVIVMSLIAKGMRTGPSGLMFAFQNSSAIFPGIVLYMLFGSEYDFMISLNQILGMALVLFGLFLGTRQSSDKSTNMATSTPMPTISFNWIKIALTCFVTQIVALSLMQGRCILFNCAERGGIIGQFSVSPEADVWFMPGLFSIASVIMLVIYLREKRFFTKKELIYGPLGGIANFAATGLLLLASIKAQSYEKSILFPCYSVATIILCNLWATKFYGEKFNYQSNAMCSIGIVTSTLVGQLPR